MEEQRLLDNQEHEHDIKIFEEITTQESNN